MDKRTYLKVKLKSLAAESKIIRREEKKARRHSIREGLYNHRISIVRNVARHTHLAYGFIRGRSYSQIEGRAKDAPAWGKVKTMVEKYGTEYVPSKETWKEYQARKVKILEDFEAWRESAKVQPTEA
jgi:hypothetical protein